MTNEKAELKSRFVPVAVIVAGISLWLLATVILFARYGWQDQMIVLALMPVVIITGLFPNTFPLPSVLKLNQEKMTFTLSDAIVLFVASWHGLPAAVFLAGIEGFTSSRRTVCRLSSNLYSFGMMSLAVVAAATSLNLTMRYGFSESGAGLNHRFIAVAVSLIIASTVQITANTGIISLLFAARLGSPFIVSWRDNLLFAAPMVLPTSTAASMMYIALQHDAFTTIVIGAPVLIAIHFGQRQFRVSVQERINAVEQAQREHISLMKKAHHKTIEALAVTINAKDKVTHDHVLRVQIYAAGVARLLGCSDAEIEALDAGALLHDIGKIAVPDYILTKPGKLTAEEFEKMKLHTLVGAQILGRVEFPYPVVPVVRSHHERWDGHGYPDGLKGEEIPLTARIISVVDCFDAVREDRPYRKGMTRQEAIDCIMSGSGTQYDPRVVGTFLTHLPHFEAEIQARRSEPMPTFGIETVETLSEAARLIAPAAGLAETMEDTQTDRAAFSDQELGALYDFTQAVSKANGDKERLEAFTSKLATFVPYDLCTVTLVRPKTGDNVVTHAAGQHSKQLEGRNITTREGVTGWVIANGRSFCNTDPKLDLPPSFAGEFDAYQTLAAFPIIKGAVTHGAITLYSCALSEYTTHQQNLLKEAAAILAMELSQAAKVYR